MAPTKVRWDGSSSARETAYAWITDLGPRTNAVITLDYGPEATGQRVVELTVTGRGGSDSAVKAINLPCSP